LARRNAGGAGDGLGPLLARTNRHGVAFLLGHATALAATGFVLWHSLGTWWTVPSVVVYGVVLAHLFALLHESTHLTAFRSRRANRAAAFVTGVLVGPPARYFALEHRAHHRHLGAVDADPEHIPVPRSFAAYVAFLAGAPYWAWMVRTLTAHAAGRLVPFERPFVPDCEREAVVREARIVLAVYLAALTASIATGSAVLLWFWLLPRLAGEPAMRLARLSEHTGRPASADVSDNTRSIRTVTPLRLLAWNMPYHAEHHRHPGVPFHALPKLHAALQWPGGRGYLAAQADIVAQTTGREPGRA
jgi:fatty acid desaturase